MIKVNSSLEGQLNSKFLIQPIFNSKKYLIADITAPILDKTEYTAPF